MARLSNLFKVGWLRHISVGFVGLVGALSLGQSEATQQADGSTALEAWIADARRKGRQDGYSIAALSAQSTKAVQLVGHRSHRSHASHYSSQGGHRSHYSHYASYVAPVQPPKQDDTRKKADSNPVRVPVPVPVRPPAGADKSLSPSVAPKPVEAIKGTKDGVKPLVTGKSGTVKSILSSSALALDDSTIVELAGVRDLSSSDQAEAATAAALARASLTKWVTGKPIRAIFVKGSKAYVFVFLNEVECRCVNVELIREGVLVADDDTTTYAHHVLVEAQKEAQNKGVGLWDKK